MQPSGEVAATAQASASLEDEEISALLDKWMANPISSPEEDKGAERLGDGPSSSSPSGPATSSAPPALPQPQPQQPLQQLQPPPQQPQQQLQPQLQPPLQEQQQLRLRHGHCTIPLTPVVPAALVITDLDRRIKHVQRYLEDNTPVLIESLKMMQGAICSAASNSSSGLPPSSAAASAGLPPGSAAARSGPPPGSAAASNGLPHGSAAHCSTASAAGPAERSSPRDPGTGTSRNARKRRKLAAAKAD